MLARETERTAAGSKASAWKREGKEQPEQKLGLNYNGGTFGLLSEGTLSNR